MHSTICFLNLAWCQSPSRILKLWVDCETTSKRTTWAYSSLPNGHKRTTWAYSSLPNGQISRAQSFKIMVLNHHNSPWGIFETLLQPIKNAVPKLLAKKEVKHEIIRPISQAGILEGGDLASTATQGPHQDSIPYRQVDYRNAFSL